MKFYQVTANFSQIRPGGWKTAQGIPTFYLRDDMQMIPNAKAAELCARRMLDHLVPDAEWFISIAESLDFDPAVIGA